MNSVRIRTKTLQQISAYLDDALSPSEKRKLETRLTREPKLREQLEKLRRTKIILGHLPHLRAPRRYILTPDMVRVRQPRKKLFVATLRLATGLSAVLLVALMGTQLFLGNSLLPVPLQKQAPMLESAQLEEEITAQPLIQWGASGVGGAGADSSTNGMGGGAESMEAPVEEMEAALPEEAAEEELLPENEMEELPEELPEMALESDMAPDEADEEFAPDAPAQDAEKKNIILGINPEEGGEIIDRSEPEQTPLRDSLLRQNLMHALMVVLAVIVILGSLTLLMLRKRRQS